MKSCHLALAGIALALGEPALASIGNVQYRAGASTNGYMPFDRSAYTDSESVVDTSPAILLAQGDWTGTNAGGGNETWRWIGAGTVNFITAYASSSLAVGGDGGYSRQLITTADFVSPSLQSASYAPGSSAGYTLGFAVDAPAVFTLQAILSRNAQVALYSESSQAYVYSKSNGSNLPFSVMNAGTIPAGAYTIDVSASLFGGINAGASNQTNAGSFSNFLFTVQVPEPAGGMAIALAGGMLLRRRRRHLQTPLTRHPPTRVEIAVCRKE